MTACFSLIISQTPWYENDVTIVSNKFLIGKQEEEIRGTFFCLNIDNSNAAIIFFPFE